MEVTRLRVEERTSDNDTIITDESTKKVSNSKTRSSLSIKKKKKQKKQQPQPQKTPQVGAKQTLNRNEKPAAKPATTSVTVALEVLQEGNASQKQFSNSNNLQSQHSHSNNNSSNNNSNDNSVKGGGYSHHRRRLSYEERWNPENIDLVVRSWKMTPGQRDKLLELQDRVRDVDHFMNDPHTLVYFIKDELGKVDMAEKYFRLNLQSRAHTLPGQLRLATSSTDSHNCNDVVVVTMDNMLDTCRLPDDYDYFPMACLKGVDREGDPIHIMRTGAADCWNLYQRHGKHAMMVHAIYNHEVDKSGVWVDDFLHTHHRLPCQFTVIFDLQGLNRSHMRPALISVCGTVARMLQDHYPELVKRVLMIRAPAIFKFIWNLIQHFFDPSLRDLMIFATSEAEGQQLMDKYIDPNVLPHVIHPVGMDGPVARGYEHVHMEGGPLPPQGSTTTTTTTITTKTKTTSKPNKPGHSSITSKETVDQRICVLTEQSSWVSMDEQEAGLSGEAALPSGSGSGSGSGSDVRVKCQRLLGGTWDGAIVDFV